MAMYPTELLVQNLPQSMRNRRFFPCKVVKNDSTGKLNKIPTLNGWNNPENQLSLEETIAKGQLVGFDIVGHGLTPDYLLIDADKVLNDETGEFVNDKAKTWFEDFINRFPYAYVEKSVSGRGLHIFLILTSGKFPMISNSKNKIIWFDKETDCKLELFYLSDGRYCLLTGERFFDNPFICWEIPEGEDADNYLKYLIETYDLKIFPQVINSDNITSDNTITISEDNPQNLTCIEHSHFIPDPSELERAMAIEILKYIPLSDNSKVTRDNWFHASTFLKKHNLYDEWCDWCSTDPERYSELSQQQENRKVWDSITDQDNYNIGILLNLAENFDANGFRARWYAEHPELALQQELARVLQEQANFDKEKESALEVLRNISSFERDTVFEPCIVRAAAFAKLFDLQAFSSFKADIQEYSKSQSPYWRDLNAVIAQKAAEIQEHIKYLEAQRLKLQGQIKVKEFITREGLQNVAIPDNYSISENGIVWIAENKEYEVCGVPILILRKIRSIEDDTYKLVLAYFDNGQGKCLPPIPMEEVLNARSVVNAVAKYGITVASDTNLRFVGYIRKFLDTNGDNIPVEETIKRGGWHSFNDMFFFVDPRTSCCYNDGTDHSVILEENSFVTALKSSGSLEEWRRVYSLIRESPVARLIIAAAIATPLLKVLGERNFMVYVYGRTTSGKSTVLSLGASAVGNPEKLIRTFDATKNGLAGLAATVHDYSLLIDEKQSVTGNLKENLQDLVYSLGGGTGRTKLNKDSSLRDVSNFRTIAVANGETPLFNDNVTGGANTRCLQIRISQPIIPTEICAEIWNVIKENYGVVFVPFIDEIKKRSKELRQIHREKSETFITGYPELLKDYCRYMSLLQISDILLNFALEGETDTIRADSDNIWREIFQLIPTQADISDATREKDFVLNFIAENQSRFVGGSVDDIEKITKFYGEIEHDYTYIMASALQDACKSKGFDYKKLVADLVVDGFFVPDDNIEAGRRTPRNNVQHRIGSLNSRCYRIPANYL